MVYKNNNGRVKEIRENDIRDAEIERLNGLVEYLSMMSDIDIPTEEEEVADYE